MQDRNHQGEVGAHSLPIALDKRVIKGQARSKLSVHLSPQGNITQISFNRKAKMLDNESGWRAEAGEEENSVA